MPVTNVLVLCGPAGVGKSSTAYEVSHQLARRDVPHALIDSDELDRVHPWPPPNLGPEELSRRNLAALWANYAALGHTRLLISGVFADLAGELRWIGDVVPDAEIMTIRLLADVPTLRARVQRREIGSAAEDQMMRTLQQLARMSQADPASVIRIDTSGQDVTAVASRIIDIWSEGTHSLW